MNIRVLLAASIAALSVPVVVQAEDPASSAIRRDHWPVQGLAAPAQIAIDYWGIPHIYAASPRDAYFVQGYNAARDRLWQIDLWRKRGLGLLSKSFGPAYVEQDKAARLFLYRGDMDAEWRAQAPGQRAVVEAFVAGINAYVGEVRAGTKPRPVEFDATSSEPDLWRVDDLARIRSHALVSNVVSEVARAHAVCAGGLAADELRSQLKPADHKRVIPAGLDPCAIPDDVLDVYFLATRAVDFNEMKGSQSASVDSAARIAAFLNNEALEGSNDWVLAPAKTTTGRPILANDPHRQLGIPSIRYLVGLNAPGLAVIGAGEPALPGITIGHNENVAYGMTIFAIDQEDLYVYETRPGAPDFYRYKGKWERMQSVRETIEVKGESPREVELRFTRHGPVLKADDGKHKAFAMRSVWWEPGGAGYSQAARFTHAKTWQDFRAGSAAWGAPPLNLVFADTKGNIGWSPSGAVPIRGNWDGLLPVPGDGRYEWRGFGDKDYLPSAYNPAEGFFASANEYNLPEGFPAEDRRIAFEWADPSRAVRIKEVLRGKDKLGLQDQMQLQNDVTSDEARRAVALLAGVAPPAGDGELARAFALLRAWDGRESVDSVPATIYEVWRTNHLGKAVVAKAVAQPARALVGNGNMEAILHFLNAPDARLGADPIAARDAIIHASLADAIAEIRGRLGPDMTQWRWGRLHGARWEPAVAPLLDPQTRIEMAASPIETGGSGSTPFLQAYDANFSVRAGPSIRLVMDVGAWDNSVAVNTPGQSSDTGSAHYRDLLPLWARGNYAPLAFSREAVDKVTAQVIELTPARE